MLLCQITLILLLLTPKPSGTLTILLDFTSDGSTIDFWGDTTNGFDVTGSGFGAGESGSVTDAILVSVADKFLGYPFTTEDASSPLPQGASLLIITDSVGTFGSHSWKPKSASFRPVRPRNKVIF